MKFWKKMALGSTAVLAAMSLAACSNGSSNSSSSSSSNKSANLTLWVDTEQVPYYKQIAKDFTKKNKNIKVRVLLSKVLTVQLTLRLTLVRTHQRLPMYSKFLTTN